MLSGAAMGSACTCTLAAGGALAHAAFVLQGILRAGVLFPPPNRTAKRTHWAMVHGTNQHHYYQLHRGGLCLEHPCSICCDSLPRCLRLSCHTCCSHEAGPAHTMNGKCDVESKGYILQEVCLCIGPTAGEPVGRPPGRRAAGLCCIWLEHCGARGYQHQPPSSLHPGRLRSVVSVETMWHVGKGRVRAARLRLVCVNTGVC